MVCRGNWRKSWRVVAIAGAVVVILALSCLSCVRVPYPQLFPPTLPDGAVVIQKTDFHRRLWREVETCSGLTYPMDKITFYAIPSRVRTHPDSGFRFLGSNLAGYGDRKNGRILLGYHWLLDEPTVRHEILHVVASPEGHNAMYFGVFRDTLITVLGKCSRKITCATCARYPETPVSKR